jgi:hypothetical protein
MYVKLWLLLCTAYEWTASLSDNKTDQMISNLISLIDDDELNLVYGEVRTCIS